MLALLLSVCLFVCLSVYSRQRTRMRERKESANEEEVKVKTLPNLRPRLHHKDQGSVYVCTYLPSDLFFPLLSGPAYIYAWMRESIDPAPFPMCAVKPKSDTTEKHEEGRGKELQLRINSNFRLKVFELELEGRK